MYATHLSFDETSLNPLRQNVRYNISHPHGNIYVRLSSKNLALSDITRYLTRFVSSLSTSGIYSTSSQSGGQLSITTSYQIFSSTILPRNLIAETFIMAITPFLYIICFNSRPHLDIQNAFAGLTSFLLFGFINVRQSS